MDAFTQYFGIRRNCCTSYKQNLDMMELFRTYSEELKKRTAQQLLASAAAGNAADRLEVGVRCVSSCVCGLRDFLSHLV